MSSYSYKHWNYALVEYFLQGVSCGSQIYLSVDETVLELIGVQYCKIQPLNSSWSEDFVDAVRREIVRGDHLDLECIQGSEESGIPKSVAFLALCVLAAYKMASEEGIDQTNYFKRLRNILNLKDSGDSPNRPKGMKNGAEELLWMRWNRYILGHGFIPSAKAGTGNKNKYIQYPISQCLLRQTDCDRLKKYFYDEKWTDSCDSQTLFSRLRQTTDQFSEYLRNLIKNSNDRYEVVMDSIHEVHQQWLDAGSPEPKEKSHNLQASSNLFAGLYRCEEDEKIEYYLYPKQKPRRILENIQVQFNNKEWTLESDRPGWYVPLFEYSLTPTNLDQGICCQITQPDCLKTLQLPARKFWFLVPDPRDPDTGIYGSWGTPELGTPFILLCKKSLLKDLRKLKDEKLVDWSEESYPFGEKNNWCELTQFMILSQAWQGVFIDNWELKDALQPKVKLSLSLSGGLRCPNQRAWLKGYPPQITVFGFIPSIDLEVHELLPHEKIIAELKGTKPNVPQVLDLQSVGNYFVRAKSDSKVVAESFVRIIAWEEMKLNSDFKQEKIQLSSHYLSGSVLV